MSRAPGFGNWAKDEHRDRRQRSDLAVFLPGFDSGGVGSVAASVTDMGMASAELLNSSSSAK